MNVSPIQDRLPAVSVAPEALAGNSKLSEEQKIAEASRQFESMLLRQILSESQKPVIKSEFTDNSTSAGIYQDFITNQLADSLSKSGGFGFAKTFQKQLSHADKNIPDAPPAAPAKANPLMISSHRHE
jgi:Rod binding domain-containing protein